MKTYRLKELLTIKNGRDHKDLGDGPYPVVGSGGIMRYADSYLYDRPSILLPRKGSLSNIQYFEDPFWTVDTLYYTEVNENLCDSYYLYCYLTLLDLSNLNTGTGVPSMTFDSYYNIKVTLPSLESQKEKAKLMKDINNKIHFNEQINRNLEAMAKRLYDYWFVQFDFPDENGRPYKTSGGKMVWNETLKRDIPDGWEVKELGEIAEVLNGATPSTNDSSNYGSDIVWVTPKDLSVQKDKFVYYSERGISFKGFNSCSTHILPKGSLLMSSRAPIGLLAISLIEVCTNQGFKNMVPNEKSDNYFLYYYLQEHMMQIQQLGSGTTFAEISKETLSRFPILYMSDRCLYKKWHNIIDAIFEKQSIVSKEIHKLENFRDKLLPLLMNGQVSIRRLNSDLSAH